MSVLSRLKAWIDRERRWRREHVESWSGWTEAEPGELGRFQREAEPALEAALSKLGASLVHREVRPVSDGAHVYAQISPVGTELWIHCDTIQIGKDKGYKILEEWDFRTPQEMIERATQIVGEVLHDHELGAD